MRRREFLGVLGAAATWPLAARAQRPVMPVIGYLSSTGPECSIFCAHSAKASKTAGYVEGENVAIEYRWAENQPIGCRRWRTTSFADGSA